MVEMSGGIFGAVGTTDHVLAALRQRRRDPPLTPDLTVRTVDRHSA